MLADATPMLFVATAHAEEALEFYGGRLGLRLLDDSPFALVFQTGATVLRIQKVAAVQSPPYTSIGWRVADIEGVVRALSERGVRFERYAWMEQDELGVWRSPSGARVAWFSDPAGNLLSLTEE